MAFLLLCLLAVLVSAFVFLMFSLAFFLSSRLERGAPFVPSNKKKIKNMLALLGVLQGIRAVDLGSGDGRLVVALARAGAQAHGYERNPILVFLARSRIWFAGLAEKAFIHHGSFWGADLSSFDVVVVYGISGIMRELEEKLERELQPGARIVSNTFPFPSWQPKREAEKVYLYERPPHRRAQLK
ncbi:MAG: hypothetical protein G01um101429_307 [Parcubacteria group bacterium Gr01-1014_29]|nr:MAG: hypothetical protein G01um101429_307 [Parcubacteria group bacterium Gr01-1014_29]